MKKLLFAFALGFGIAASACGPFFPPSYLAEEAPHEPELRLNYNLALIGKHFFPDCVKWQFPEGKGLSTAEGTKADFLAAGHSEKELETYLKFDAACQKKTGTLNEFHRYLLGYEDMRNDPGSTFPAEWKKLLNLPPAQRKYRTAWVYYMLGNLALKSSADEAYRYYRLLREAVGEEGFTDSLNLARLSYRTNAEQARNPFDRLRYTTVLAASGGTVWNKGFLKTVEEAKALDIDRMRRDPVLREILLLTAKNPVEEIERIPDNRTLVATERVAARCYFANRLKECKTLLGYLPADSLMLHYLKARFFLREGESAKAAESLAQWLKLFEEKKNPDSAIGMQEVQGVLGTILVEQQDFLQALRAFQQAESWNDAAIVAEQLLSTDALKEYCDNHTRNDDKLRYLLARRLMRDFRVAEAGNYFPANVKPLYELYHAASRRANDAGLSADERALSLFQLGRLLLRKGDELRGTELEPDNFIVRGQHEELPSQKWRDGQYPIGFDYSKMYDNPRVAGLRLWAVPLPDLNRITRRFHYRRNAADCFARAGVLATDKNLRSAAFWAAGNAILPRHPDEANEYFLFLSDTPDTPLGVEARKRNWFPPAPKLNDYIRKAPLEHTPAAEDFPSLLE